MVLVIVLCLTSRPLLITFHSSPCIVPSLSVCSTGTRNVFVTQHGWGRVTIGPYTRPWSFHVIPATPLPVVLGLDAVRGWPLFYSPLDDCLFVVEEAVRCEGRCPMPLRERSPVVDKDLLSKVEEVGEPEVGTGDRENASSRKRDVAETRPNVGAEAGIGGEIGRENATLAETRHRGNATLQGVIRKETNP